METNKLLTLEEIEEIEKFRKEMIELEPEPCELGVWQVEMSRFNQYQLSNLLATARAYWELKKKEVHVSCGQCGMSTFVDIEDTDNNKSEDKPTNQYAYTVKLGECASCGTKLAATNMAVTTCDKCNMKVKPEDKPEESRKEKKGGKNWVAKISRTGEACWELEETKTVDVLDKPHARTIKAVIEALGYIKHVDNSTGAELAIKSLEKHLE